MLIVLDLDETLIHATAKGLNRPGDFTVGPYQVYRRPYLSEFLNDLFSWAKIGVWSSASDDYVEEIVQHIFPDPDSLEFVWGGTRCTIRRDFVNDVYVPVKRLSKLKPHGFSLEKILMIDDSPEKMQDNYGNGIVIRPFYGELEDQELRYLSQYLLQFKGQSNVREIEKRNWRSKF